MKSCQTPVLLLRVNRYLLALIGAGGLGDIILLGIDRNNTELIVLGAIPAAILAIIFDFLLRSFEKLSFKKLLVGIGGFAAATIIILALSFSYGQGGKHIVIAGKLGSEPDILINMYKLLIEEDTDLHVEFYV